MTNAIGLNTGAIKIGLSLIGVGALFASAGAAVCAAAFAGAAREYVRASEMSPSELAMDRFKRAKSAAQAGIGAWSGPGVDQSEGSVSSIGE